MPNCAEQEQIQNYKTHAYKTPKTACVRQSCSNIRLSSKDGLKKKIYVSIKLEKIVSMYTYTTLTMQTSSKLYLLKKDF